MELVGPRARRPARSSASGVTLEPRQDLSGGEDVDPAIRKPGAERSIVEDVAIAGDDGLGPTDDRRAHDRDVVRVS